MSTPDLSAAERLSRAAALDDYAGTAIGQAKQDWLRSVWRARSIIAAAMLGTILIGIAAAAVLKPRFTAGTELLVLLSSNYAMRHDPGDPSVGAAVLDRDSFMQAETEILGSSAVARDVVRAIGVAQLYPELARPPGLASQVLHGALSDLMAWISHKSLAILSVEDQAVARLAGDVIAKPDKSANIIAVTLTNANPIVARAALLSLVANYMRRRAALFTDNQSAAIAQEVASLASELAQTEGAYAALRDRNGILAYDIQRDLLLKQRDTTVRDIQEAESAQAQASRRVTEIERNLADAPADVALYQDSDVQSRIGHLKSSLDDMRVKEAGLRAQYGDNNRAVVETHQQVGNAEAELLKLRGDRGPTAVRRGRNPLLDTLAAKRTEASQDEAAAAARIEIGHQHLAQEQAALQDLEREQLNLQTLDRQRSLLDQSYRSAQALLQNRRLTDSANANGTNIREINDGDIAIAEKRLPLIALVAGLLGSIFVGAIVAVLSCIVRRNAPTPLSEPDAAKPDAAKPDAAKPGLTQTAYPLRGGQDQGAGAQGFADA